MTYDWNPELVLSVIFLLALVPSFRITSHSLRLVYDVPYDEGSIEAVSPAMLGRGTVIPLSGRLSGGKSFLISILKLDGNPPLLMLRRARLSPETVRELSKAKGVWPLANIVEKDALPTWLGREVEMASSGEVHNSSASLRVTSLYRVESSVTSKIWLKDSDDLTL